LIDLENHLKTLNHDRLVQEVNRIQAIKDEKFVDKYFDTYEKSVIVKNGE